MALAEGILENGGFRAGVSAGDRLGRAQSSRLNGRCWPVYLFPKCVCATCCRCVAFKVFVSVLRSMRKFEVLCMC